MERSISHSGSVQSNHQSNMLTSPVLSSRPSPLTWQTSSSHQTNGLYRTSSSSLSSPNPPLSTRSRNISANTTTQTNNHAINQSTSQFEQAVFHRPLSNNDRAYIKELTTYSLSRLETEPSRLLDRDKSINQSIINLSVSNYKTFIDTGTVIHQSFDRLIGMESSFGLIADRLPDLSNKCADFLSKSESTRANQSINRSMLDHQITLLEMLELPSLMETCVRSNMFDEACDLYEHIQAINQAISQRHTKEVPIIGILAQEMDTIKQSIRSINLSMLQSNIQLSQCLRVISHLRRIDQSNNQSINQSDELQLRLTFLSCREQYVQSLIDAIGTKSNTQSTNQSNQTITSPTNHVSNQSINESQSHYEYLTRLMDIHRVHVSDVVTQYRAIFVDESIDQSNNQPNNQSNDQTNTESAKPVTNQQSINQSNTHSDGLLHRWCHHRINQLITSINHHLPLINESSYLYNLIEQSIYCGSSLSRVGCDFRSLIVQSFEQSIKQLFDQSINQAPVAFSSAINEFVLFVPLNELTRLGMPIDQSNQFNQLIQFPPLIAAANSVIQSINRIRHVALIALMHSINQSVQSVLQAIANQLKTLKLTSNVPRPTTYSSPTHHQSNNQSINQSDLEDHWRDPVAHLSYAFINQFVPYINSLVNNLYGDQVTKQSIKQANKLESQLSPLYEQQLAEVRRVKQSRARTINQSSPTNMQSPHSFTRASSSASSNHSSALNSPRSQPLTQFSSPRSSMIMSPKSVSIDPSTHDAQSGHLTDMSNIQPADQSIKQSIKQSIEQSIDQSNNQSNNQSNDQPTDQSADHTSTVSSANHTEASTEVIDTEYSIDHAKNTKVIDHVDEHDS